MRKKQDIKITLFFVPFFFFEHFFGNFNLVSEDYLDFDVFHAHEKQRTSVGLVFLFLLMLLYLLVSFEGNFYILLPKETVLVMLEKGPNRN